MKDKKMAVANSFALAMAVIWIICSIAVWLLPDLSMAISNWWMHGLDMRVMGVWNLTLANFIMGGLTAIVSAWLAGWILGWSWEIVNRKE